MVRFAGLPTPEPNAPISLGEVVVHGDLWFPAYRCVGEYEGEQHQLDRGQYVSDIDRYALYQRHDVHLVQLTKETLGHPRALVRRVHDALVLRGYAGPPPSSGPPGTACSRGSATSYPGRATASERWVDHRFDALFGGRVTAPGV